MATPITLTIFDDPVAWLTENGPYIHADGVSAIVAVSPFRMDGKVKYEDREEGTKKSVTPEEHVEALRMLCEQVGRTLFVGGVNSPYDLLDPGRWDIEVYDAFRQLAYHKKVIYG
jgi:hypothetical protein